MRSHVQVFSDIQDAPVREHWIDIARFIAACLIVCVHVPTYAFANMFKLPVFDGRVPFFLILAGYFIGRNLTWHKAIKRCYTLLVPFVAWNAIVSTWHLGGGGGGYPAFESWRNYLCSLVGFKSFIIPAWTPSWCEPLLGEPFSTPTWFLRDIILCSLLAPILLRCKYLVFILILVYYGTDWLRFANNKITLAPGTVAVFGIGLLLSTVPLHRFRQLYTRPRLPYVLLCIGTGTILGVINYLHNVQIQPEWPMHTVLANYGLWHITWPAVHLNILYPLLGACLLMMTGMYLERRFPVTKKLSDYAPACFLIFILHYPLINCIPVELWKSSLLATMALTAGIIAVIVLFYYVLRTYCPVLLPYLANDRMHHDKQTH